MRRTFYTFATFTLLTTLLACGEAELIKQSTAGQQDGVHPDGKFAVVVEVIGLDGKALLQNNEDILEVAEPGMFVFPALIEPGASYAVKLLDQPSHQYCKLAHANGKAASFIEPVQLDCATADLDDK